MRNIIVTGAASGIGRQLAQRLLACGERVCAVDLDETTLERLQGDSARLMKRPLDVRDAAAWELLLDAVEKEWDHVDVLINNAGVLRDAHCWDIRPEDVDLQIDVNTKGLIFGTVAAARRMKTRGRGQIINIASLAGVAPVPGLNVYSASKFAARGFSLAAATELAEHGVKVTVVCPDAVETPMLDQQKGQEAAALTFSGSSRALTPDDVCDAILKNALVHAPVEICLPNSRGGMAKMSSLMPGLLGPAYRIMRNRGLKQQARLAGH